MRYSRTLFWSSDKTFESVAPSPKRYEGDYRPYWYAFLLAIIGLIFAQLWHFSSTVLSAPRKRARFIPTSRKISWQTYQKPRSGVTSPTVTYGRVLATAQPRI